QAEPLWAGPSCRPASRVLSWVYDLYGARRRLALGGAGVRDPRPGAEGVPWRAREDRWRQRQAGHAGGARDPDRGHRTGPRADPGGARAAAQARQRPAGGPGDDRRDSPTTAEGGPTLGSPAQTRQRAPHQTRAPSTHQTARVLSPARCAASSRYVSL